MTDSEPHRFQTTHWTQVVAARGDSPEARHALAALCETYYEPVALFVRRSRNRFPSQGADDAQDLTHEFFAKLLEGHSLDHADRTRGRFRSYLLGAVKHFLADRYDRDNAIKRGGGGEPIRSLTRPTSADDLLKNDACEPVDPVGFPSDAYFDRQWGLAVVEQSIETLREEAGSKGEADRFQIMHSWLVTPSSHETAIETARSLGLTEGAFKVAVHRLRKRFRQVVVERIAATVEDPADVPDELNYLIAAVTASVLVK